MPPASPSPLELARGVAPLVPASKGVSLAWVEGMESVSQWINGRYVVADDWELLG